MTDPYAADLYEPGFGATAIAARLEDLLAAGRDLAAGPVVRPSDVLKAAAALLKAAALELEDLRPDPSLAAPDPFLLNPPRTDNVTDLLDSAPEARLTLAGAMVAAVLDRLEYIDRATAVGTARVELNELVEAHAFRSRDRSNVFALERFLEALDPACPAADEAEGSAWEDWAFPAEVIAALDEHAPHVRTALTSVGVGLHVEEVAR